MRRAAPALHAHAFATAAISVRMLLSAVGRRAASRSSRRRPSSTTSGCAPPAAAAGSRASGYRGRTRSGSQRTRSSARTTSPACSARTPPSRRRAAITGAAGRDTRALARAPSPLDRGRSRSRAPSPRSPQPRPFRSAAYDARGAARRARAGGDRAATPTRTRVQLARARAARRARRPACGPLRARARGPRARGEPLRTLSGAPARRRLIERSTAQLACLSPRPTHRTRARARGSIQPRGAVMAPPACVERREAHDAVAERGTRRPSSAGVPGRHVEQRREESAPRRQAACAAAAQCEWVSPSSFSPEARRSVSHE